MKSITSGGRFHAIHYYSRRYIAQTPQDNYLTKTLNSFMLKYEDFIGLSVVREAQAKVIQAEAKFEEVQTQRRNASKELNAIASKLKPVAEALERTSRGTDQFLELAHKQHALVREEEQQTEKVKLLEKETLTAFNVFSSALRDSHEKERAHGEKTKYWSIIGSIIGAIIGFAGTKINNSAKMAKIREIVKESVDTTEDCKNIALELCNTVKSQTTKYETFLEDLKKILVSSDPKIRDSVLITGQISDLLQMLKKQDVKLTSQMIEIKNIIGLRDSKTSDGNIVYVGPQVEEMLSQTERNLEWKIKISSLATVTILYGAFALTLPLILSFFKGN